MPTTVVTTTASDYLVLWQLSRALTTDADHNNLRQLLLFIRSVTSSLRRSTAIIRKLIKYGMQEVGGFD